jgi:hypothetical protein
MEHFNRGIALRAAIVGPHQTHVAQPLVMAPAPEGGECPPFLMLGYETAQRLMDEFWNCGLRPSEGAGSAGAMAATQKHLADMRAIVAEKLKVAL